jgi:hypothetical protein
MDVGSAPHSKDLSIGGGIAGHRDYLGSQGHTEPDRLRVGQNSQHGMELCGGGHDD